MQLSIHGIPVTTDPSLSSREISLLVSDLVQSRQWEGRELARVELIRDGNWIQVHAYDKPSVIKIPRNPSSEVTAS